MVSYWLTHTHLEFSERTSIDVTRLPTKPNCYFLTRGINTLDLCFTSHPNIILNCDSIPGFSDHHAILATLSISYYQPKQEPCKISLYRKANWDMIRGELSDLSNEYFYINSTSVRTVDENWSFFLTNFQNIINNIVPSRTIREHTHPPSPPFLSPPLG